MLGYGPEHDTWEPESNLTNRSEVLQAFWDSQGSATPGTAKNRRMAEGIWEWRLLILTWKGPASLILGNAAAFLMMPFIMLLGALLLCSHFWASAYCSAAAIVPCYGTSVGG